MSTRSKSSNRFNSPLPPFDENCVSTKTVVVMTNMELNIQELYNLLPITPYVVVQKKRGTKKVDPDPNAWIPSGSIITVRQKDMIRGVDPRKNKKRSNSSRKSNSHFLNSISLYMIIDGKRINSKVYHNGKFHMTGCKTTSQAIQFIKYMWDYIRQYPEIYQLQHRLRNGEVGEGVCDTFYAMFANYMRNIDFYVGFNIDKVKLNEYICENRDEYRSELGVHHTGLNIKMNVPIEDTLHVPVPKISFDCKVGEWTKFEYTTFEHFLELLPEDIRTKRLATPCNNTFIVFQSGITIMSARCSQVARGAYEHFVEMMREHRDEFEEKIIE